MINTPKQRLQELANARDIIRNMVNHIYSKDEYLEYARDDEGVIKKKHPIWHNFPFIHDFESISSGKFSVAYKYEGTVIKLAYDDYCWQEYIQFCFNNSGDPHIPKFRDSETIENLTISQTERLQTIKGVNLRRVFTKSNYAALAAIYPDWVLNITGNPSRDVETFLDYWRDFKIQDNDDIISIIEDAINNFGEDSLLNTLLEINNEIRDCRFDLHPNNIMRRGNIPVLLDPVFPD